MHTAVIVTVGLALLLVCLGVAHVLGRAASGVLVFLSLWLVGSGINMYVGVRAGYSVSEEIPFFLLVFVIPVAAALVAWWALGIR